MGMMKTITIITLVSIITTIIKIAGIGPLIRILKSSSNWNRQESRTREIHGALLDEQICVLLEALEQGMGLQEPT